MKAAPSPRAERRRRPPPGRSGGARRRRSEERACGERCEHRADPDPTEPACSRCTVPDGPLTSPILHAVPPRSSTGRSPRPPVTPVGHPGPSAPRMFGTPPRTTASTMRMNGRPLAARASASADSDGASNRLERDLVGRDQGRQYEADRGLRSAGHSPGIEPGGSRPIGRGPGLVAFDEVRGHPLLPSTTTLGTATPRRIPEIPDV